ncbi:hypothetical protein [Kribbella sp. CA-293567]|uniref:hypothetical protein n=1 Tax=Kribbella sp. CA-293567 TaxID=3002436 RepID=UPI0022DD7C31|nr:hypothetical protein [Kribbella sp. CA-293567]WBQ04624.1 hypothetical protein OX958_32255 [Kribbella sp. CA-293567]
MTILYGPDEELHLFEPGKLSIPDNVAEEIPDVGVYFLYWATQNLRPEQAREIESAVNGRRCQNGWFPLESLANLGRRGAWRGPLTYLAQMTAKDSAIVKAWATINMPPDGHKRRIEDTADRLLHQQGHAAAATWVMAVRPQAFLSLTLLGDSLYNNWESAVASLRPKDVAKSVRRWNR